MRIQDLLENSSDAPKRHGFYIVQRARGDRFEYPGSPTKFANSAMAKTFEYLKQTNAPVRVELTDHQGVIDRVIIQPGDHVKNAILNLGQKDIEENFADGRGPGRPGDSQRQGIPKHATMAQLKTAAKAKGRKGQLARWQINMRRGKK